MGDMKKILFLGALLASSAGWAEAPAPGQAGEAALNPNEMICRSVEDTGSRLSRSRICMTRGQWADHRRNQRQTVERNQASRPGVQQD
jgi:hypothetical protein